jgi:hypothetical protein
MRASTRFAAVIVSALAGAACGSSGGAVPHGVELDGSAGSFADAFGLADGDGAARADDVTADAALVADALGPDATVDGSASDAPDEGATPEAGNDTGTPSVADNPPTPPGYKLMMQSEVTADMTSWTVSILEDPTTYPMFSTATMTFGTLTVLARVEWHPPDFQNGTVHRGVTLYEPV